MGRKNLARKFGNGLLIGSLLAGPFLGWSAITFNHNMNAERYFGRQEMRKIASSRDLSSEIISNFKDSGPVYKAAFPFLYYYAEATDFGNKLYLKMTDSSKTKPRTEQPQSEQTPP